VPEADTLLRVVLGLEGTCTHVRVQSRHLADNPLGDPAERILPVYLPRAAEHDRLPVVYFLPSYAADARGVLAAKPWEETFFQRVDRLIRTGVIPPIIIVAVDGWTRLGGSQYVDSIQNGRYASYIIDEVFAAVDAQLPTRAMPRARAFVGKSSGGFGALHLAMRHPGSVGAIAAHSADGYFRYAPQPAFVAARRELTDAGSIATFVERFETMQRPSTAAFETILTLAYAAAYSPHSAERYAINLPFDLATGAMNDDVFSRWLAFDPVEEVQVHERREALRALDLCYLDCGNRDEYGLDVAARLVAQTLAKSNIACVHEEFSGGHRGMANRYDRSLQMVATTLHSAS
jgi:S-formylglutathione hydrolase FrmB